MIDLNETKNYLKARKMMCDELDGGCKYCPLSSKNNGTQESCNAFQLIHPEKAIEILEEWIKENTKTLLSVFIERNPNAKLNDEDMPNFCPSNIFNVKDDCDCSCKECWNREYKKGM